MLEATSSTEIIRRKEEEVEGACGSSVSRKNGSLIMSTTKKHNEGVHVVCDVGEMKL